MPATLLLRLVNLVFTLYSAAIIVRAFLSWFNISSHNQLARFLYEITEPLLAPLRRYVPVIGGLDFTPMVALVILWLVESLLSSLILALFR
jgi:YggT family protein